MIRHVSWVPTPLIRANLTNFTTPPNILHEIPPDKVHLGISILVHIMLLCYTAKKLLNDPYIVIIISQFIELNNFPGFW
jgi:hypothetical protein